MSKTRTICMVVAIVGICLLSQSLFAQNTATNTVQIRAIKAESLAISGSALSQFDLDAPAAQDMTITSSWNLRPGRTNGVEICVYMTADMTGNTGNGDVIPQAAVETKVGSGVYTPINTNFSSTSCGIAGGATSVKTYPLANAADHKVASTTDTVGIQINTTTLGSIQADTYKGTINLIAYAL